MDYAIPAVGIAPLPGQAQPIISSLAMQSPTGETPTGPALRGACSYTTGWKQQNPTHVVAILLVTDGVPEAPLSALNGCNPTLQDAQAAAAECLNGPGQVRTFVLGVGASLTNLDQIAQSGGTQNAYLVEGGNVTQQVFDALTAIRGSASVPCEFQIPPPPPNEVLNFNSVNIEYTDPSGARSVVYYVDSVDQCPPDGGGWYYDTPSAPSKILLCPSTCTTVEAQLGAQINVALGCGTIRPPM
jgi:hypothetical protein